VLVKVTAPRDHPRLNSLRGTIGSDPHLRWRGGRGWCGDGKEREGGSRRSSATKHETTPMKAVDWMPRSGMLVNQE
jgi:hypothetical protein